MATVSEIGGYVATAAGFGLEFSGFAPSWVLVQTILFVISAALSIFDTYTDWEVVLNFKENGFDNPLLQRNDDWLRAWFLFAAFGSVLTVISICHDGIEVFYSIYKSCQKHLCKCCTKRNIVALNDTTDIPYEMYDNQAQLTGHVSLREQNSGNSKDENSANEENEHLTKEEDENSTGEDDEITDPFKYCFRHGWNSTTRNETLSAITFWFYSVPMMTMAVLYAYSQNSCKTPNPRDVTPALQDVGISATVAVVASTWRFTRSFIRIYFTIKVAGKVEPIKCLKYWLPEPKPVKPPGKFLKKILPKASESAYPPGTCAHHCLRLYYGGALTQMAATMMAVVALLAIWAFYGLLKNGSNFDASLGIYRFLVDKPDTFLFNISGNIIPSNGSFVNLEQIPYSDQTYRPPLDIYCLSEFEYRKEDFEIFFNAIKVQPVSEDGQFCATFSGEGSNNSCYLFYTFHNFILYYASRDPTTGDVERFDETCTAVKDIFGYRGGPKTDPDIDVRRLINREGFPQNNEPLVVYYPSSNEYLLVSELIEKGDKTTNFPSISFPGQNLTLNCMAKYSYSYARGAVTYNYKGAVTDQVGCSCSRYRNADLVCINRHHTNVTYGYLTQDPPQRVIPYTHCSILPSDKIVPQRDSSLFVPCLCI